MILFIANFNPNSSKRHNQRNTSLSKFEMVVYYSMVGRKEIEGPLMRNNPYSLRKSRIVTAVVIGVLIVLVSLAQLVGGSNPGHHHKIGVLIGCS
jgi:hypothetical protein